MILLAASAMELAAVLAVMNEMLPVETASVTFCNVMTPVAPVIWKVLVPATVISLL